MKLLIDGYNLIKSMRDGTATPSDIEHVLATLRRYSRYSGHKLIVVFDGGESMYRFQRDYRGLCLWYSGTRETADDLIKELLPRYNADELVLVSDDRQLNDAAQDLNIVSVSPIFFMHRVHEREAAHTTVHTPSMHGSVYKTTPDDNEDLDALMRAGSQVIPHKADTDNKVHVILEKKRSKVERRLHKLIDKL